MTGIDDVALLELQVAVLLILHMRFCWKYICVFVAVFLRFHSMAVLVIRIWDVTSYRRQCILGARMTTFSQMPYVNEHRIGRITIKLMLHFALLLKRRLKTKYNFKTHTTPKIDNIWKTKTKLKLQNI